jgi:hypothetical protein
MKPIHSFLKTLTFLGLSMVMVACSVPQATAQPTVPSAPTVDVPALHTQVAQTVVAQITVQAALNPSPTLPAPAKPTDAPATLAPTPTAALASTNIPTLVQPIAQTATWRVQQTPSKTPYVDVCTLQSTQPPDYSVMDAGSAFEAYWVVKNNGMRTWNSRFYFKKVTGDLGYTGNIFLANPVDAGGEYTLHISMLAPKTAGNYNGTYKLVNDDGVAICQFFVAITVR